MVIFSNIFNLVIKRIGLSRSHSAFDFFSVFSKFQINNNLLCVNTEREKKQSENIATSEKYGMNNLTATTLV